MNGKDLLMGLGHIDHTLIDEAGTAPFPAKRPDLRRYLLIAAAAALTLMLVGCGIAYARGWFPDFFTDQSRAPLNEKQVSYLSENEQIISQKATQNGWTVELRSAINDGTTAYIILGVSAPEGITLEGSRFDENMTLYMLSAGNHGMLSGLREGTPLFSTDDVVWRGVGWSWKDDGDGLPNTANWVLNAQPNLEESRADPFSPETEYRIHIEDFVEEYLDPEYMNELETGKYKDQPRFALTPEEARQARQVNVLGKGTWDFTIHFAESLREVELLSEPITVQAYRYQLSPDPMWDSKYTYGPTAITSFALRPLGATVSFDPELSLHLAVQMDEHIWAVMKDGSRQELLDRFSPGTAKLYLQVNSPIVVEEVDHILLPDGTTIPMP